MRNRMLHDAVATFVTEAGAQLAADTAAGHELPFELVEEPGAGASLYCYQPLTEAFIRERIVVLGRLPSYVSAARMLESMQGLGAYLRRRGEPRIPTDTRESADAVLRTLLGVVFHETSEFAFDEERFERAYGELEASVYEDSAVVTIVAPLHGLALAAPDVPLGEGLALVRADAISDAPHDVQVLADRGDLEPPGVLASLTLEVSPEADAPVSTARRRFRRLLTALRLFEPLGVALAPAGWTRTDDGAWRIVALGGTGRPRGVWWLDREREDELRAFANLVARRTPESGEVAWALARFEMGCERLGPFEALTDHLLALRAVLEPEGAQSGRLAGRLAAICAVEGERGALAERVAHAISLERATIAGLGAAHPGADGLVHELAGHLQAILRDVLCGHLDTDLVSVADELEASAETGEHAAVADDAAAALGSDGDELGEDDEDDIGYDNADYEPAGYDAR